MMDQQTPTSSSQSDRKPRIRRIGATRYMVESRSQPGVGRQVDTLLLRCSCPAGRHGRRCHHLVTALAVEDWRKREEAKARAARQAEVLRTGVQAATWSSAGKPAGVPGVPSVPGVPAPVRQTGDLLPLSRWFE